MFALHVLRVRCTPRLTYTRTAHTPEIDGFHKNVESLLAVLSTQAKKLERAKLLAIGQKNRNINEAENRRRRRIALQSQIALKKRELERARAYTQSLQKTELEQKLVIEKINTS